MTNKELIKKLRTESLYKDKATLEIMDLCMEAALALEKATERAEQAERERDAAINDIMRAEAAAEAAENFLNDSLYFNTEYSVYSAAFAFTNDIIKWQYDDVWRKGLTDGEKDNRP